MAHGTILGQSIPDLNNNYLALDGSNSMTGRLNANGGIEIPSTTEIRMPYNTSDEFKMFLDSQIPTIKSSDLLNIETIGVLNLVINNVVKLLASSKGLTMYDQLSMSSNKITKLADGTADTDAATVGQLNAAVANVGPQYAHPTGNASIDFYGFNIYVKQDVPVNAIFGSNEQNCFTVLYKYITGSDPVSAASVLTYGLTGAVNPSIIAYRNNNWIALKYKLFQYDFQTLQAIQ